MACADVLRIHGSEYRKVDVRSNNEAWKHVDKYERIGNEGKKIWICKYCNEIHTGHVSRVEAHLGGVAGFAIVSCPSADVPHHVKESMTLTAKKKATDRENKKRKYDGDVGTGPSGTTLPGVSGVFGEEGLSGWDPWDYNGSGNSTATTYTYLPSQPHVSQDAVALGLLLDELLGSVFVDNESNTAVQQQEKNRGIESPTMILESYEHESSSEDDSSIEVRSIISEDSDMEHMMDPARISPELYEDLSYLSARIDIVKREKEDLEWIINGATREKEEVDEWLKDAEQVRQRASDLFENARTSESMRNDQLQKEIRKLRKEIRSVIKQSENFSMLALNRVVKFMNCRVGRPVKNILIKELPKLLDGPKKISRVFLKVKVPFKN